MRPTACAHLMLCLLFCSCTRPESETHVASTIAVDGAQIWDGSGRPAIPDGVIVIKDGRIEAVGPRGAVDIPAGATVIPGEDKTLIPGLINAHGHVGMTRGLKAGPENYSEENILAQLRQYARYGVTTVLSLGT